MSVKRESGFSTGIKALDQFNVAGRAGQMTADALKKPTPPGPTDAQLALERSQREQLAGLDDQENKRRKRLLSSMQGLRSFTGSALFRSQQAGTNARAAAPAGTLPAGSPGIIGGGPGGYGRMFDTGRSPATFMP